MNCFQVRALIQRAEALGEVNRYYCAKYYGRPVADEEVLMRYFIGSGGAENFAKRFANAMSLDNRWYCSQLYGHEVCDIQLLWDYYVEHESEGRAGVKGNVPAGKIH